ncbi:MAG: GLPGLI family protein [Duncaniella sp.]|nr:GLPGLI family protein [Duncaniella sp.]
MNRFYIQTLILGTIMIIVPGICFAWEYSRGPQLTVDTAKYKLTYQVLVVRDTAFRDNVKSAYIVTLIGNRTSKSVDRCILESSILADSLIAKKLDGQTISDEVYKVYSKRFFKEQVIMDYPQKGINLFQTAIAADYFRVYDDDCKQDWYLMDETKDILGYECRKAVCDFRGRSYEAWYTEDVPISTGPYYFRFLPGLIVELYDTEHDYTFSLVGLEKVEYIIPIEMYNSKSVEVTNRADLRYIEDYYSQDAGAVILSSPLGSQIELTPELLERINRRRPYNPIEKE